MSGRLLTAYNIRVNDALMFSVLLSGSFVMICDSDLTNILRILVLFRMTLSICDITNDDIDELKVGITSVKNLSALLDAKFRTQFLKFRLKLGSSVLVIDE